MQMPYLPPIEDLRFEFATKLLDKIFSLLRELGLVVQLHRRIRQDRPIGAHSALACGRCLVKIRDLSSVNTYTIEQTSKKIVRKSP